MAKTSPLKHPTPARTQRMLTRVRKASALEACRLADEFAMLEE